jgi:hypothetical protein
MGMSHLISNIPPIQCFIRKEFLYDFKSHEKELEPCYWVSVKSIKGRAFYFESLLTNYGALYDKLPISAYVWKEDVNYDELLPLDYLQIWDCLSYDISILEKSLLKGLRCKVFMKNKKFYEGNYILTIDNCYSNPNEFNNTLSETPNEHKSFNLIKLDNGQFTLQPNNRVLFYDQSLIASGVKIPDFKVSTKEFSCENGSKWSAGDDDKFFYDIKKVD